MESWRTAGTSPGSGRTEGTERGSDDKVCNWPGKLKGLPLGSSPRCSG